MTEPLIEVQDLHFAYAPDRPVLRGVELKLMPGERLGLVGAIGSGKTTLLHLLVGLRRPERGRIVVFGQERRLEKDFIEIRPRAGLLFQDPEDQLFCPTVGEDVAFGPLNQGKSPEGVARIVRQTLQSLGIEHYERRLTHNLSGGQKRLASLAAVLAMQPEILLLDEPTGCLDEAAHKRIAGILAGLSQAMIVISHDAHFLSQLSSRTLKLQDGAIAE
jgi:cobalt/nickel transport system ATP-binding protein